MRKKSISGGKHIQPYQGPAGGWGSLRSVAESLKREKVRLPGTVKALFRQNKTGGVMCASCAWAKPHKPHLAEFCENGAKATAAELTSRRASREFFLRHSLTELREWRDFDLEQSGRLMEPMVYDAAIDRYVPIEWGQAIQQIAEQLKLMLPDSVAFYSSGRASLETSYLYALFARLFGTNNLPDSSNMCHETTGAALKTSIGSPVGTVVLEDFEHTDLILIFGQNCGSNSPRMLHDLQLAAQRGVPIVTFNPLHERGLERFTNPQNPLQMLAGGETVISSVYHAVQAGGDIAAIMGLCKALVALDRDAKMKNLSAVLNWSFIQDHTQGFDEFVATIDETSWQSISSVSGLSQASLEQTALLIARAKAIIGIYGMGLTQHWFGEHNVHMLCNLMLLGGHVGQLGAGLCPVRGHSNVQGQRTVGISDNPLLVPLDRLAEQFHFSPPRSPGMKTVDVCKGVLDGRVKGFIGLGGNFVRAIPDTALMERAWSNLSLTVQIATKLNRTHLLAGRTAYLLPCLGRMERDVQGNKSQAVSMEDSTSCIHGSLGTHAPAGPMLRSELRIVAELAEATLPRNEFVPWQRWASDYSLVRDAIEATYPDQFAHFNERLWSPGGFHRPNAARHRVWETSSGKAQFISPPSLDASGFDRMPGRYRLITLRSNDQFNTTIYGLHDRFRGIVGTREIVFMNPEDILKERLLPGQLVTLSSDVNDGVARSVKGLEIVPYDIPSGCIGGYFPECNPLVPLSHHAQESKTPAFKSVPVRIAPDA